MKYIGMPFALWRLFCRSFEKNLTTVFGISKVDAKSTMAKVKEKYKERIENLPEFEKGDRFQLNIVSCAMLATVGLSMPERPEVDMFTEYYSNSMMTGAMK